MLEAIQNASKAQAKAIQQEFGEVQHGREGKRG
jgi:hypothetical protein